VKGMRVRCLAFIFPKIRPPEAVPRAAVGAPLGYESRDLTDGDDDGVENPR
jgi:hypothetical protein